LTVQLSHSACIWHVGIAFCGAPRLGTPQKRLHQHLCCTTVCAICKCVINFVWLRCCCFDFRLDEIIVFRQLTKGEVKQIADIMLGEVFKRAEEKEIKIDVTERFKVKLLE